MDRRAVCGAGFKWLGFTTVLILGMLTIIASNGGGGGDGGATLDTDGDGLTDAEETGTYGTSPVLADTDGDGYSDWREIVELGFDPSSNNYRYNPLIADMPKIEFVIATVPQILLNYNEGQTNARTIENTSGGDATTGSETTHTTGGSITVEGGVDAGLPTFKTTLTAHYSWTGTQITENTESWEESVAYEEQNTVTTSGGSLRVGLQINNTGYIPYTIENIVFSATQTNPGDPTAGVIPIANLTVDGTYPNTSLAPGGSIPLLIFSNSEELNINVAKSLLMGGLNFPISHAELLGETGRPLVFDEAEAQSRSAKIGIDYGFTLPPEEYVVATNRVPDNPGETLADIFNILKLNITVGTSGGYPFSGIDSVGRGGEIIANNININGRWLLLHTIDLGFKKSTTVYDTLDAAYDLATIDIHAGDVVLLVYILDEDGDRLGVREERLLGTDPLSNDTDGDGLTDYEEVRGESSWRPACNDVGDTVNTSPVVADADRDTLNDGQERSLLNDPYKTDSDGDTVLDGVDGINDCSAAAGPIISNVFLRRKNNGIAATGQIQANIALTGADGIARVTIDWGDSTPIWETPAGESIPIYTFNPPPIHEYPTNSSGIYTVTITSTDDAVPPNTATQTFQVDWKSFISYTDASYADYAWHNGKHSRMVADVTGDAKDDLIAFGDDGIYVAPALSDGSGFGALEDWHLDSASDYKLGFGSSSLYSGYNSLHTAFDVRRVQDVNNDDRADIVVFANDGVYVGVSTGDAFMVNQWFAKTPHTQEWTPETTDGLPPVECGDSSIVSGISCRGRYCDNIRLECADVRINQPVSQWSDWFSEEQPAYTCPDNRYVTGIKCTGDYCDSISLQCAELENIARVEENCYWTDPISEEQGVFEFPAFMYLAGVECQGSYCDNKKLYLCQGPGQGNLIEPNVPSALGDVDGDGDLDWIHFDIDATRCYLNEGDSFSEAGIISEFNFSSGWSVDLHPRALADIDGDGADDLVGFHNSGIVVGRSNGDCTFSLDILEEQHVLGQFTVSSGWNTWNHPRIVKDIDGDGKADILGFGPDTTIVALNTTSVGGITFDTDNNIDAFDYEAGWKTYYKEPDIVNTMYYNVHPRTLVDVDSDGDLDLVGFFGDGVVVGLYQPVGMYSPIDYWSNQFDLGSIDKRWLTEQDLPVDCRLTYGVLPIGACTHYWYADRTTGDVNGDGRVDFIGFGNNEVLVVPGITITETTP